MLEVDVTELTTSSRSASSKIPRIHDGSGGFASAIGVSARIDAARIRYNTSNPLMRTLPFYSFTRQMSTMTRSFRKPVLAEQLSARAVRLGKNLEAIVIDMLEAGAKR